MLQANPGQDALGFLGETIFAKSIPSIPRQTEQRESDVVLQRVLGKQGDDLVGARQAEMYAAMGRLPGDFLIEKKNPSGITAQIPGHQVEQRRLAGAVRADDQPPLALLDLERDVVDGGQPAEGLLQAPDM